MAKSLATNNYLRALHLKISEGRTQDALPLTTIKGLRHLHLETADIYTTEDSPLALIWNSRSTLRSLTLDKSVFQYFYKNIMDRTEELNGSPERQYDFTNLKSLSLQRVSWTMDPDEVDAVTRAIDFTALESVDLSHQSMRMSLLFQRLTSIFSSTDSTKIKLQRLSLNVGYQAFTNRGDQTAKTEEEEEPGLGLISSFDTLTSLIVHVHSADLPNPVLKDAMLQGILKHKNLSTLEIMNTYSIRNWNTPYLDANTVAFLIDNLPRLRHFRFRSTAIHLVRSNFMLKRRRPPLTLNRAKSLKLSHEAATWRQSGWRYLRPARGKQKSLASSSYMTWCIRSWRRTLIAMGKSTDGKTTVRSIR